MKTANKLSICWAHNKSKCYMQAIYTTVAVVASELFFMCYTYIYAYIRLPRYSRLFYTPNTSLILECRIFGAFGIKRDKNKATRTLSFCAIFSNWRAPKRHIDSLLSHFVLYTNNINQKRPTQLQLPHRNKKG